MNQLTFSVMPRIILLSYKHVLVTVVSYVFVKEY